MATTLEAFFHFLDALRGRAPLPELLAALTQVDVTCANLADFVRFADRGYRRNLLRTGIWYQAWVMCWKNGQRSPIHDHGSSSCGMRVLRGNLTETRFEFAANGHIKATASRDFVSGSVLGSENMDLHQVSNLQAGDADLVTLHVYTPPLLVMGTYSLIDRSRGEEPMPIEFADAAGI